MYVHTQVIIEKRDLLIHVIIYLQGDPGHKYIYVNTIGTYRNKDLLYRYIDYYDR